MTVFRNKLTSLIAFTVGGYLLADVLRQFIPNYFVGILTIMCINAILALSWNLVSGFTGQFSLGHAGFMAIGAYTSGLLMMKAHWAFLPALLTGGLFAAVMGFLVGFPSLRLVGDYLAVVTLSFSYIILAVLNNTEKLTGGGLGIVGVPLKTTLPVAVVAVAVTTWLFSNLIYSRHGRSFMAVKEDEIAAQSVGINTTYFKVAAFTISSFFAGIGGALIGHFTMYLHPDIFNYAKSVESVTMVILGGLGSLTGSLVGAVVVTLLPEVFRNLGTIFSNLGYTAISDFLRSGWMVFYSLLFIIIMLARPNGIMNGKELSWASLRALFVRREPKAEKPPLKGETMDGAAGN